MLVPGALASVVRDAKSLIVVPSGSLYLLAFESLVTRDPATWPPLHPRYLVDDVPGGISYVPSASLLATVRGAAAAGSRRDPLVAFANPAYPAPSADERGAHAHGRGVTRGASLRDIPRIPGTDREARAVFAKLRRQPVAGRDLIEGDAATRDRVLALSDAGTLRRYRYLLFATHAVLPNEVDGVTLPSIVLAHPERGTAYGFLTVADILRLSLDADFVALSACNTGIEQPPSGDGISGLTRAFLYAGTPGISVTLWPVDDRAAPRITPPFFKLMNDGATPAAALRSAKLAMLRAPEAVFRHPYAWAPSVVFGDGDTAGARR
jgi:CHAT domain-containing protein